jgi:hypothetical protein
MTIYEPATLLTDGLLAVLAGGLAWRLHHHTPATNLAACWWSRTLGLTALSALVGGCHHGFAPNFSPVFEEGWWIATLLIISLVSAAMALSLLHELRPAGRWHFGLGLIGLKFIAFAIVAIILKMFVVVIIDYGLAMLAWAVAAVVLRRAWSGWMLTGISLSVGAALVQQLGWAPSRQFNHNDLYHVIQALALIGFYAAGRRFTAAPAIIPAGP